MDYGEGGREYGVYYGKGRRGGPRPAGIEGAQQVADVLRVLVYRSDEVDGKSEGEGVEFDRGLRLDATSLHGPPSPKLSASAGCPRKGNRYAVVALQVEAGSARDCKGLRLSVTCPGCGSLSLLRETGEALSDARTQGSHQHRRSERTRQWRTRPQRARDAISAWS